MHLELDYEPRAPFVAFHERAMRWGVLVVHRRGGKTVAGIMDLIKGAMICTKPSPRFAYLAPYRQQAKLVAWDYLKRFTAPIPGRTISESELHVKLPRDGRVTLYGADNYDALRGIYLDGAVVDEPADMAPEVWTDLLRPALSDRLGWCVWIGTPKGRNAFFRLYDKACSDPDYYTMMLPASQSGILPPSELQSARKAMGQESYDREFECSFNAAIPGSIYGDLVADLRLAGRIQDFEHNRNYPLITAWDVGDSDYCVQWLIQLEGRHINVLDFNSEQGEGPGHYADRMREWEAKYGAAISAHYLPHDANNVTHGSSWKSDLEDAGLRNIKIVPRIDYVWDGIASVRGLFPRFYIHKTNCGKAQGREGRELPSGLDCLEFYAKEEVEENHTIKEKPIHNEFSHGCDAMRCLGESYDKGMIDGTSTTARESRREGRHVPKTLRGPGPQSYPLGMFKRRETIRR
jgi:phage terminase large subunit